MSAQTDPLEVGGGRIQSLEMHGNRLQIDLPRAKTGNMTEQTGCLKVLQDATFFRDDSSINELRFQVDLAGVLADTRHNWEVTKVDSIANIRQHSAFLQLKNLDLPDAKNWEERLKITFFDEKGEKATAIPRNMKGIPLLSVENVSGNWVESFSHESDEQSDWHGQWIQSPNSKNWFYVLLHQGDSDGEEEPDASLTGFSKIVHELIPETGSQLRMRSQFMRLEETPEGPAAISSVERSYLPENQELMIGLLESFESSMTNLPPAPLEQAETTRQADSPPKKRKFVDNFALESLINYSERKPLEGLGFHQLTYGLQLKCSQNFTGIPLSTCFACGFSRSKMDLTGEIYGNSFITRNRNFLIGTCWRYRPSKWYLEMFSAADWSKLTMNRWGVGDRYFSLEGRNFAFRGSTLFGYSPTTSPTLSTLYWVAKFGVSYGAVVQPARREFSQDDYIRDSFSITYGRNSYTFLNACGSLLLGKTLILASHPLNIFFQGKIESRLQDSNRQFSNQIASVNYVSSSVTPDKNRLQVQIGCLYCMAHNKNFSLKMMTQSTNGHPRLYSYTFASEFSCQF